MIPWSSLLVCEDLENKMSTRTRAIIRSPNIMLTNNLISKVLLNKLV